jgi:hypothetical protein
MYVPQRKISRLVEVLSTQIVIKILRLAAWNIKLLLKETRHMLSFSKYRNILHDS